MGFISRVVSHTHRMSLGDHEILSQSLRGYSEQRPTGHSCQAVLPSLKQHFQEYHRQAGLSGTFVSESVKPGGMFPEYFFAARVLMPCRPCTTL